MAIAQVEMMSYFCLGILRQHFVAGREHGLLGDDGHAGAGAQRHAVLGGDDVLHVVRAVDADTEPLGGAQGTGGILRRVQFGVAGRKDGASAIEAEAVA